VVLPITVALLTSAAARAGDGAAVRQLADELLALRSEPGPGWGIGFPSDAFGDGSVNPANTIYGLVKAFAAGALLDAFEARASRATATPQSRRSTITPPLRSGTATASSWPIPTSRATVSRSMPTRRS
jgi:hypothetical protein